MNNIPKEKTNFDIFIKPIIENLMAPIFGYIAAFAVGSFIFMVFTGETSVPLRHPQITYFAMLTAQVVLAATAIITVGRFLNDDISIFLGKAMQEPKIQKLKAENTRLKLRIDTLLQDAPEFGIQDKSNGFANDELEVTPQRVMQMELDKRSQVIFDNAIWLWNRAIESKKITKAAMTGKDGEGMAQPAWAKATKALINTQIISSDRDILIADRETVVEKLYEYLGDN